MKHTLALKIIVACGLLSPWHSHAGDVQTGDTTTNKQFALYAKAIHHIGSNRIFQLEEIVPHIDPQLLNSSFSGIIENHTLLGYAIICNKPSAVRVLLKNNADSSACTGYNKVKPLALAQQLKSTEIIKMLS